MLARDPDAVRTSPHLPACLTGNYQLVSVLAEVPLEDAPEVLLRRTKRRPVVVREVEMGDAAVECAANDGAPRLEDIRATEVLPKAEGDRRELQAREPASAEVIV